MAGTYIKYVLAALGITFIILKFLRSKQVKKQIQELIASKKTYFLLDVRTVEEFESGSVMGAKNIPIQDFSSRIGEVKDKENIIVFCKSGVRAAQAKSLLISAGHDNVINGGSWVNVGHFLL
jgi:phage shock protein E